MGLDMYAYAAARAGQRDDYWDEGDWDQTTREFTSKVTKPLEIAYWRKHPNLHAWFAKLWAAKGHQVYEVDDEHNNIKGPDGLPVVVSDPSYSFNGVELELTWEDIDQLEHDLNVGTVKDIAATGFFWGEPSDSYYREQDLAFIKEARAQLFLGVRVFYNSSW